VNNIKDLLNRVDVIVKNSEPDTLTEINNISNILEVDGKTATLLHFVNKDGHWNPNTITMLEDVVETDLGDKNKKLEFYLLNYLDTHWREITLEHIKNYTEMNFFNVWVRQITSKIINDVEIIGLYPEDRSNFIHNKNFPNDGSVHPLVSEWLTNVIREVKPEYRKEYNSTKTMQFR
tara:strand:- start:566 stop:1096 length:531 start_codon:yes stop_codon:yes gene_type:complete